MADDYQRRSRSLESVLDRVYEASLVPDLWPEVLTEISASVGGSGAVIFADRFGDAQWRASPSLEIVIEDYIESSAAAGAPLTRLLLKRERNRFHRDEDVFTSADIKNVPLYRDFLLPLGFGYGAGAIVPIPETREVHLIYVAGSSSGMPMTDDDCHLLNEIFPHLSRSILLSAQVGLSAARASSDAMRRLGVPAAVLGRHGVVLHANELFLPLIPEVFTTNGGGSGQVSLVDPGAHPIGDIVRGDEDSFHAHESYSIAVKETQSHPPLMVHAIPLHGAAADVFLGGRWIIVVTTVVPDEVPAPSIIAALFDLTPTEARVTALRVGAWKISDIAYELLVGEETVRTHLGKVFRKLGVANQTELIRLVHGSTLLPPRNGPRHGEKEACKVLRRAARG